MVSAKLLSPRITISQIFFLPDSYAFLTPKCFKNVQPKS